jgi:hypothetical protein
MFRQTRITMALGLLVIAAVLASASTSIAGEPRHQRQGFFLGLDAGIGGSYLEYEKDGQKYESDEDDAEGGAMAFRMGYAFNPYFSLSLDMRGFSHLGDDFDYSLGTSTISATVYPMGGGFFLRAGLGGATLETEVDDDSTDPLIEEFEEHGVALGFGLGYDWFATEHFAIGLSLEMRGACTEDFDDFENVCVGESALGVTMNYYF